MMRFLVVSESLRSNSGASIFTSDFLLLILERVDLYSLLLVSMLLWVYLSY